MLATAEIFVTNHHGERLLVRALIDQGSEVSLMTENLAQLLRLPRREAFIIVDGVGSGKPQRVQGMMIITLQSRPQMDFNLPVRAFILPKVTSYQPHGNLQLSNWPHLEGLELADPNFNLRGRLDLILGVAVYGKIIEEGLRKVQGDVPIAQKTALGWILSGETDSSGPSSAPVKRITVQHCCEINLQSLMQKFWEQEELPAAPMSLTEEERQCEDYFTKTHVRTSSGRYMVRLPTKENLPHFGNSKALAVKMQSTLERRFQRDPNFAELYRAFMTEYRTLGHMEEIKEVKEQEKSIEYFLPHHGVIKESSATTKLRVVFNGSQITSVGQSLNHFLLPGPNLLPDLADVLLRWRVHKFVFSADVEKMYRQILVNPKDRALQQIVWRDNTNQELRTFQLKTVTYGLTCAPFLAIRTLQQLAKDEEHRYPLGAITLRNDCYVDDILTGDATLAEARQRQVELISMFKAGGFTLRKWTANTQELIPSAEEENNTDKHFSWPTEGERNILGIKWNPSEDSFTYQVTPVPTPDTMTKRLILSRIAKLFDPLGWISPITISAKIFMQSLWLLALDWDTPVPTTQQRQWERIYNDLSVISQISIPRWIQLDNKDSSIEFHGFADASESAKAAVVYVRVIANNSRASTFLVASKTKVASLKPECIARKELCAIKLLADLLLHVRKILNLENVPVHMWSDSKVALAWLQAHPRRWNCYVANRVSAIRTALPQAMWHHIEGSDNPADCASRGMRPGELKDFHLWWHGPNRLTTTLAPWSTSNAYQETDQEIRKTVATAVCQPESQVWSLLHHFSSLTKLVRITAWCQRWRVKCAAQSKNTTRTITTDDLRRARLYWVATVQRDAYSDEIEKLRRGSNIGRRSSICKLSPILDKDGLLRVGGRLKHSLLSYEEKHPIILPPNSTFTKLVIAHAHHQTLHGGVQLTLGSLRRLYWIPRGRSLIKSWIHKCVRCTRWRASTGQQQMEALPTTRVTPSRPFLHSGLDYAGPVMLRTTKGRGHKAYKGYIAIFICFSTKAVHLEAVSDYTAAAFIAAFHRFISRRGICSTLTSDCGSNFIGAASELRKLFGAATKWNQEIADRLANDGTQWRFNPPAAPHFGGLWEAAVKSTKFHLRRVIGDCTLTYEEMATFLTQVEACLNSRPLQPLNDDPEDLTALTPGHFLIGAPLCAIPEPSLSDVTISRLTRWQLLRRMQEHFWKRWSQEYLQTLQPRGKWTTIQASLKVGDLCLIKSETLPPTKWPLARIIETHPGEDGLTRVVTVKTGTATLKRPVIKIIPLNISD